MRAVYLRKEQERVEAAMMKKMEAVSPGEMQLL